MEYALYRISDGTPLDGVEVHVLARAYRAAWLSMHALEPEGWKVIESLDLLMIFEAGTR